jgi:hypothetical protein
VHFSAVTKRAAVFHRRVDAYFVIVHCLFFLIFRFRRRDVFNLTQLLFFTIPFPLFLCETIIFIFLSSLTLNIEIHTHSLSNLYIYILNIYIYYYYTVRRLVCQIFKLFLPLYERVFLRIRHNACATYKLNKLLTILYYNVGCILQLN